MNEIVVYQEKLLKLNEKLEDLMLPNDAVLPFWREVISLRAQLTGSDIKPAPPALTLAAPKSDICKDFANGRCNRGNHCKFSHFTGQQSMSYAAPAHVPPADRGAGAAGGGHRRRLLRVVQAALRRPLKPEDVVYETWTVMGQDGTNQLQSSVRIEHYNGGASYLGDAAVTEAGAEEAAAKIAIDDISVGLGGLPEPAPRAAPNFGPDGVPTARAAHCDKEQLARSLRLLLNRNSKKGDVEYETVNIGTDEAPMWQSTAKVVAYDGSCYAGEVGATEKEAENNAAKAVIVGLEPIVKPLEENYVSKRELLRRQGMDPNGVGPNGKRIRL